jgi:hypothetical protein
MGAKLLNLSGVQIGFDNLKISGASSVKIIALGKEQIDILSTINRTMFDLSLKQKCSAFLKSSSSSFVHFCKNQ